MQKISARDDARTSTPILRGDRCRCPACGEYLNSTGMFDRHRTGKYPERRCLTPAGMLERGFRKNAAGFWIRSEHPYSLAPRAQERRSTPSPTYDDSRASA